MVQFLSDHREYYNNIMRYY